MARRRRLTRRDLPVPLFRPGPGRRLTGRPPRPVEYDPATWAEDHPNEPVPPLVRIRRLPRVTPRDLVIAPGSTANEVDPFGGERA